MLIEFSKIWGNEGFRWNYCGGDWNYRTMIGFMEFYGIKEALITDKAIYFEGHRKLKCNVYTGWATKEIERLKKHWYFEYCKPCVFGLLRAA